jgi:hypothetical protein
MELDTLIVGPFESVHPECWAQQARHRCLAVLRRFAQRQQERVGQEDKLTAWTQKTPASATQRCGSAHKQAPLHGNGKIEGRIRARHPFSVAMDKGKIETAFELKTPGGSQLRQRVVDGDRA